MDATVTVTFPNHKKHCKIEKNIQERKKRQRIKFFFRTLFILIRKRDRDRCVHERPHQNVQG